MSRFSKPGFAFMYLYNIVIDVKIDFVKLCGFFFYTSKKRQKRQSDQRIAELETLLALQKYGVGSRSRVGGRNSAGYGLIDFNYM